MGRRKKKDGFHLKYIPAGRLNDLQELANNFPFMKDKTKAFYKYVETFSSIVERCKNADKEFVGTSVTTLSEYIGGDHIQATKVLNDLVESKILDRDKSKFKIGEKAWDYKPATKCFDVLKVNRKFIDDTSDMRLNDCITTGLYGDDLLYKDIIYKLELDNSIYDFIRENYNNYIHPYDARFVHPDSSQINDYARFVQLELDEHHENVPYQIIGKIPSRLISVYKLLAKKFRISRPHKNSRVYTNITNLGREFRQFLRLNGKPLIGFDIANSQPLIATILFLKYSQQEYQYIKEDVLEYQRICEQGKFYEYFMELNGVDLGCEAARTKFKKLFFGKVFYTMEVEKDNYLKTQFKEKYPTCYQAMFFFKGGLYSEEYKDFPSMMTELETAIMFDANIEAIKLGYNVVNIFDSLYSESDEAIAVVKKLVLENFAECGIKPTLKDISYRPQTKAVEPTKIIAINKGNKQTEQASLASGINADNDNIQTLEY